MVRDGSFTSTWTRSTRRSSSATTRRCAANRSRSAGGPIGAVWSPRRATRRVPSASTPRCRWPGRSGSARRSSSCRPTSRTTRPRRPRCSRSSVRSRRSSSRCRSTRPTSTSPRTRWSEPLATHVARRLKERIRAETGLTASAGVAPNKFLAKIASGWKKPDGLTVISPERVEPFLQRLPVDALWGVGPVTARKLRARGIERLVDVRTADTERSPRNRRQPCRLAAPAGTRHRRPSRRAEPRDEVVGIGEHLCRRI